MGKLSFIGTKGAQILNLGSGKITFLPKGARAQELTLSPTGTAVYSALIQRAKLQKNTANVFLYCLQSSPPYSSAKFIMSIGRHEGIYFGFWNPQGTKLYFSMNTCNGVLVASQGKYTITDRYPATFDAAGNKLAQTNDNDEQIIVRDTQSGRSRVLFDVRHPAPMFAALKRARNPKNLADLLSATTDPLTKDAHNWQLSDPALAPDGSRLYFASNAGTGFGAQGNGEFALFAVDLKTNTLSVLSKVGANFGRPPHIFRVSPDGKRLLVATSVHSSAADNSCSAYVVDLQTQNSREVFNGVLRGSKNKANFLDSTVWSPDGKYVALSGYFYDAQTTVIEGDEAKPEQYTTGIVDATTGRLVRTIQGATSLGWAR